MRIVGFVGASGTGKSHRAQEAAKLCGADAIIDDGLLISDRRVIAGVSATETGGTGECSASRISPSVIVLQRQITRP